MQRWEQLNNSLKQSHQQEETENIYFLRSTLIQKNEEVKQLLSENKSLKLQLNERPKGQEVLESLRKVEELEKIIELLK